MIGCSSIETVRSGGALLLWMITARGPGSSGVAAETLLAELGIEATA